MEDQRKKLWLKPEVIIISATHDINGGANPTVHEGHTGQHKISTTAHGVTGYVGTATYNNAHS